MAERLGILGTGAIALGLARVAEDAVVWARSADSAARAEAEAEAATVVTDLDALRDCTYVVEAVVENLEVKGDLLGRLSLDESAIVASTTSSLGVAELALASGRPDRFAALHVFNPVEKMDLVEIAFPDSASDDTRERSLELARALGKTPVEVPDWPGFVVNRLLFPFLFEAVRLAEHDGLEHEAVDQCMKLGAAHPMGPFRLLDFVGIDVAVAIGESLDVEVPDVLRAMVDAGKLGRKSGAGFYDYDYD
ncbi:MAG: 3-hydroxyacyl-CoA dehydrogenase family protein [Thermoleophilaceae bacterium]|nr:3-hydroxyacyl-CoA dehydrogenase family protein [Thermoleophilaceae bacterium]